MKRVFRVTAPWRLNENFLSVHPRLPWRQWSRQTSGTSLSSTTLDWGLFTTLSYGKSFQSCCKIWIFRLESFYGPCTMVLRPIWFLDFQEFLNHLLPEQRIGPGGQTARPAPSPDLQPLIFLSLGTSAVYYLSYRSQWRPRLSTVTQNGFETIRTTPGIFKRIRQSLLRHATSCIEAQGGHFEHFL